MGFGAVINGIGSAAPKLAPRDDEDEDWLMNEQADRIQNTLDALVRMIHVEAGAAPIRAAQAAAVATEVADAKLKIHELQTKVAHAEGVIASLKWIIGLTATGAGGSVALSAFQLLGQG